MIHCPYIDKESRPHTLEVVESQRFFVGGHLGLLSIHCARSRQRRSAAVVDYNIRRGYLMPVTKVSTSDVG